jgi:hypothetical protein
MAKRKTSENMDNAATAATPEIKSELPHVESPSISPAITEPVAETVTPIHEPEVASQAAPETASVGEIAPPPAAEPAAKPRFTLTPRRERMALLAASVTFAAALGTVIGALASGGFSAAPPQKPDVTAMEERKAMQQSIAQLSKQITTLKANIEVASKSASAQIAKVADRFDRAGAAEITGSISAPQTVAPLPTSRPQPRVAAVETQVPAKPSVVQGWTIREARDGFVYVEGRGEVYQVMPGAPLPGVGVVEAIKRQDGRWVVVTPKGIIVSMRDRRYFE